MPMRVASSARPSGRAPRPLWSSPAAMRKPPPSGVRPLTGAVRTCQAAPAPERPDRTRPFLKIQDGCDFACTFCIIPAVRGPNRSLPPDRVVEAGRRLAAGGHPEIVLTGINLGTYGWDLRPRMSLSALLQRLLDETAIPRIRLSSLHPHEIKPEMVRL